MFHNDWTLYQLAKDRERDLMRQLEHDRLVRLARTPRKQRGRFAGASNSPEQFLIKLGGRLQAGAALLHDAALHAAYHARSKPHTHHLL